MIAEKLCDKVMVILFQLWMEGVEGGSSPTPPPFPPSPRPRKCPAVNICPLPAKLKQSIHTFEVEFAVFVAFPSILVSWPFPKKNYKA